MGGSGGDGGGGEGGGGGGWGHAGEREGAHPPGNEEPLLTLL